MRIVWPEDYNWYLDEYYYPSGIINSGNFDFEIKEMKLQEIDGKEYDVIFLKMTSKKEIFTRVLMRNEINTPIIHQGDSISSVAIYFKGELIGFKQYGIGCYNANVINSFVGDIDKALSNNLFVSFQTKM